MIAALSVLSQDRAVSGSAAGLLQQRGWGLLGAGGPRSSPYSPAQIPQVPKRAMDARWSHKPEDRPGGRP